VAKDKIRQRLRAIGAEQQKLTEELESSQTGLSATALAGRCCSKTARVELVRLYSNLVDQEVQLRRLRQAASTAQRPT
jgi:hypothetical protein